MKYLFLFGRTPLLSRAELLRLIESGIFSATIVRELEDGIVLEAKSVPRNLFERLGGTIRVVELDSGVRDVPRVFNGKFNFGFTYFHLPEWRERRRRDNIAYKKLLLAEGIGARFIDAKESELPTPAVIGNRLIDKGAEFVIYRLGVEELWGKTIFIQDIDAYTARDQTRPARDARVGMLPLKLAQSMINLGVGPRTEAIWDPMVGTGVVLQEALLMGYRAYGSDNSSDMVEASRTNIEWLRGRTEVLPESHEFIHDISAEWPANLGEIEAIITEGYLGKPRHTLPNAAEEQALNSELIGIYRSFFASAAQRLRAGSRVVICFPFFESKETSRVNFVDELASGGYTLHGIYDYRPHDQIVGRQVTVFEKV